VSYQGASREQPQGMGYEGAPPRLEGLPSGVFDAELVAFEDGLPSFPLVCQRILSRARMILLTPIVFDVLAYRRRSLIAEPYRKRRQVLVAKRLNESYKPGERAWVKTKNRDYWWYELERKGALKISRRAA
jgi:ATP-dependent DNA ligase